MIAGKAQILSTAGFVRPLGAPDAAADLHVEMGRLIAQAEASFHAAAKAAVAENDRLGIHTHGAVDGVLVTRPPQPPWRQ